MKFNFKLSKLLVPFLICFGISLGASSLTSSRLRINEYRERNRQELRLREKENQKKREIKQLNNFYEPFLVWDDTSSTKGFISSSTYGGRYMPWLYIRNDTIFAGGGGEKVHDKGWIQLRDLTNGNILLDKRVGGGGNMAIAKCKNHFFLIGDTDYSTPIYVTRVDLTTSSLDSIWVKTYVDSAYGMSISADNNGKVVISGDLFFGTSLKRWWIGKIDTSGLVLNEDTVKYGECGTISVSGDFFKDGLRSVKIDNSGNIYGGGHRGGDMLSRIISWDQNLNVRWWYVDTDTIETWTGGADGNITIWNNIVYWARAPPEPGVIWIFNKDSGDLIKRIIYQDKGIQEVRRDRNKLIMIGIPAGSDSAAVWAMDTTGEHIIWEKILWPAWVSNLDYVHLLTFNLSEDKKRIVVAGFTRLGSGRDIPYIATISNPSDTLKPRLSVVKPKQDSSYDTLNWIVWHLIDSTGYELDADSLSRTKGKLRDLSLILLRESSKSTDTLLDTLIDYSALPLGQGVRDSLEVSLSQAAGDTGNYVLQLKAEDWFFNSALKQINFSIQPTDTLAPTKPVLIKPVGWLNKAAVEFAWHPSTDNTGISHYTATITGTVSFDTSLVDTSFTKQLSDSRYTWQVTVYDAMGNAATSDKARFAIDTQKPLISNTTQLQDTSFTGPYEVKTSINEDNLREAKLIYLINSDSGATELSYTGTGNYWQASIPALQDTVDTVLIQYCILAQDSALNESRDPAENASNKWYSFRFLPKGLEEAGESKLKIKLVNPSSRLELRLNKEASISIYDVTGRLIYASKKPEKELSLRLPSSIYFVKAETSKEKIIKKVAVIK